MAPIGSAASATAPSDALARSRERAALIPDLLVEARRVAATMISGWHGRRQRGTGETFWQYRPYSAGETARIDWRRSGRDDHTYVRDNEWEAAHTVWLWADPSPSMLYQSRGAKVSKESRSLVLTLALAELLAKSGERVGWLGLSDPISARNAAERIAARMSAAGELPAEPDLKSIRRHADIVIVSDFLDEPEATRSWLEPLVQRAMRCHLIEVADPAEEVFPFRGRTRFRDPESGAVLIAGRAESVQDEYRALYLARREELSRWARALGWSYTVNHTDSLASEALVRVHGALSTSMDGRR